ncbi:MAG: hypothetical protein JSW55_01765 [Chloroflexota bacterium]|nr:MAG: hypothetical protein JSW55_01765 [Chloroflexota bacterium]
MVPRPGHGPRPGQRTTTLTGRVADQAALHGLLAQIRDLGMPLLSLTFMLGGDKSKPRD